jgi:hypothetical protein
VRAAADDVGQDYQARLRAMATAYVRFAIRDAALLDLMFAVKNTGQSAALEAASALVTSGRAQPGQVDALIVDAVALFTHGWH